MKFLRYLPLMLLTVLSTAITACGDDDDKDEPLTEPSANINTLTFTGTTVSFPVTGDDDNPDFSTTESVYTVRLDRQTRTCVIEIEHPRFLATMPANLGTMVFPGVPFTFTDDNGYEFKMAKLIPQIANTPYPTFQVSAIEGEYDGDTNTFELEFTCDRFSRSVEFHGAPRR